MEHIESINLERIDWCCADYGITRDALAQELSMAPARFNKVMAGELGLSFAQLRKLADFFGRGVLFFMAQGPVDEERAHSAQFRTLRNQKTELTRRLRLLIARTERQREVFLALQEDLDPSERVCFTPPDLQGLSMQAAANRAREWLGLGANNDFDSYRQAVEARGILVFRSNGYNGDWQIPKDSLISGFSLYYDDCPVIVIKKQDAETRQSFTLMHELGHLLLHRQSWIDDVAALYAKTGKEQEANAFAGYLLVPDRFLSGIDDSHRPADVASLDAWLEPHRKAWGVSVEMILRRLADAGRLPHAIYAEYRHWSERQAAPIKEGGSRAYRNREPRHIFGDGYVRTVLDAMNARRITLTKASSYLDNLKIADLHKLEQSYAGV